MITEEDKDMLIATLTLQLQDKEQQVNTYAHEIAFLDKKIAEKETRIAELEQENESYQKLINDICNKHRVGSLKDLDEIYQATTESLYASREYLEELKSAKWELEEQLKNAIVPKFKQYQQVFYINNGYIFSKWSYECECQDGIIISRYLLSKDKIVYYKKPKDLVFATKEEAEAKLKEVQGE